MQTPERHVAAVVHARLFGSPHKLSPVSHAPLTQTRVPTAAVHVLAIGAPEGTGCPFGIFGAHVPAAGNPVALLHHSCAEQSASTVQSAPHAPVVVLQIGPACAPTQSRFAVHLVHAPPAAQYGLVADVQAAVVPLPLSPLHGAHAFATHVGVDPVHAVPLVAVQVTHWFVVVLQAGVAPVHVVSATHGSHFPLFAPFVTQTPLLH